MSVPEISSRPAVSYARTRPGRSRRAVLVASATLLCVTIAGVTASAATASPAVPDRNPQRAAMQLSAEAAVKAGLVGYVARVDDGRGVSVAVAGLADRATRRPLGRDDQFEIGSTTKTFMATIALQLVAEHRLRLTDSVERWLPGVVPNGRKITVRDLLQHTSGLFDYTTDPALGLLTHPHRVWTSRQLVALAVKHPPSFAPGRGWEYSSTNYILVGMILQKVTGRSAATLVQERIARPLGLHRTYLVTDVARNTGPGYAHGYIAALTGTKRTYTDVSGWSLGGWVGTAGAILSTPAELARFLSALLSGRLLPAAQLAQMTTVVPASVQGNDAYGLGLARRESPCGTVWGHVGATLGHMSFAFTSPDGRRTLVADTNIGFSDEAAPTDAENAAGAALKKANQTAVCAMHDKPLPAAAAPKAG
jgi:D-alanyl-D-alanine carboxypeptidase